MREMRVEGIPQGSKTREEGLVSMWLHCGGLNMVSLTVLRPDELEGTVRLLSRRGGVRATPSCPYPLVRSKKARRYRQDPIVAVGAPPCRTQRR